MDPTSVSSAHGWTRLTLFVGLNLGQVHAVEMDKVLHPRIFGKGSAIPFKFNMKDAEDAVPGGLCVAVLEVDLDVAEVICEPRDERPGLRWSAPVRLHANFLIHECARPSSCLIL